MDVHEALKQQIGYNMHVTLATSFEGGWNATSQVIAEALKELGCTVYNPSTDSEHKSDDKEKSRSNWLVSFRQNGVERSCHTEGFVYQIQERGCNYKNAEVNDMQQVDESMVSEIARHEVPRIGVVYGTGRYEDCGEDGFPCLWWSDACEGDAYGGRKLATYHAMRGIVKAKRQWAKGIKDGVENVEDSD